MRRLVGPLLGVLLAGPGLAQEGEIVAFQSPTGNIHCMIYGTDQTAEARCDLLELVPSRLPAPRGCDLDWGHAFAVERTGRAGLACVGDTVADPGNAILIYGAAVSLGGITCVSAKTGVTCTNAEGHG